MILRNKTNILGNIIFEDETYLFHSYCNIKTLFSKLNKELEKLGGWFTANGLSLNINNTK